LLADAVHCQARVNIKLHAGRSGAGRLLIAAARKVPDSDNPGESPGNNDLCHY